MDEEPDERKVWRGHAPWPALEGGHSKQRHHALQDVVKVEFAVVPLSLGPFRLPDVAVLVHNVKSPGNHTHKHAVRSSHHDTTEPETLRAAARSHLHSASVCLELSVQKKNLP